MNTLAGYLSIARQRMRGQVYNGNPQLVSTPLEGVNVAQRIISDLTHGGYTSHSRKNAFFGPALTGLGFDDIPDVLPISE